MQPEPVWGGQQDTAPPLRGSAALGLVRIGHPQVASVIPGARSARHVQTTVDAFRHPIPPDLWAELKHERLIRDDAPVPA